MRHRNTSWNRVADWYRDYLDQTNTYQRTVIFPRTAELLQPNAGGHYLDIACGEGSFLAYLHQHYHVKNLMGLDAAPKLIQAARAKKITGAKFVVGDAQHFSQLCAGQQFTGASCILALQNLNPFAPVLAEASRVLLPGSYFVIVLNHPCFRLPRQSGWGWDQQRQLQYRRIDQYISSYQVAISAHPGKSPYLTTYSYHRPLHSYSAALHEAGFMIQTIEEWTSPKHSQPGPRAKAENRARQEFPLFLALKAVKRPPIQPLQ
ncbi:MAG: class I SAM-dependent methyltransferase [Candidatus Kerfeldbacteria bacterium]|nr:class I SAM-dependent methyltransferase [Candidatus Kerfeldbacteria bacterium]